ncbi:MAG: YopX family protein [Bacteroidales bacterium]|nr:YopX family protein [Bacteroidales bacterium]
MIHRGKRKNGEWVYGYYVKATQHWHKQGVHEDWIINSAMQNGGWFNISGRYAVDNVCESTRLRDKNNKTIFVDDIVKQDKNTWLVMFYRGSYRALNINNNDVIDLSIINEGSEVVGNIYDNKDWLAVGKWTTQD